MSLPTIGALLSHSGPPEVAGPVAGFIIDAVKCEEGHAARVLALRSRAYLGFHVGNEGAHVVPGFVDADAATAPVPVARPVLFVAATHHRRVETVERVGVEAIMLSAGTCVEWLRDDLAIIDSAADSAQVAARCGDTGDVWFVQIGRAHA